MRSLLAAALIVAASSTAAAAAGGVTVRLDESTPVALGGPASQVVVGNPAIADVTVIDRRHFMILGRGYGVTNIVALDANGRAIYNARVTVGPSEGSQVSVYRGTNVYNYACAGRCERSAMPGEPGDPAYNNYAQPAKDYADRAKAASGGPGGN